MSQPEPLFLAFDTTAAHCAAVLLGGGKVLATRAEPMTRGHAERLMPMLGEMLAGEGLDYGALGGMAVAVGPGNFTGIRIGVSAARGLAMSLGIPSIGVSVLEALAHGQTGPVLALADARQGRLYGQVFEDGAPFGPPVMGTAEALEAPAGARVIGFEAAAIGAALGLEVIEGPAHPPAELIARAGLARDWRQAPRPAPLYIRPPDAAPPAAPAAR